MILYRQDYGYEVENVARSFFPYIQATDEPFGAPQGDYLTAYTEKKEDSVSCCIQLRYRGIERSVSETDPAREHDRDDELVLCRLLYLTLQDITGKAPPWGMLTGVRPAKRAAEKMAGGMTEDECRQYLKRHWLCSRDKAEIAVESAKYSAEAKSMSRPESYSLYISIPFCPSRCKYCSFVSRTIGSSYDLVDPYIEILFEELNAAKRTAESNSLRLESIYIGGGTPTSVTASQLDKLLGKVSEMFDIEHVREFTVEAGRPDTITAEKLGVLRRYGVDRISINPQTGNDRVLRENGRLHTAKDIESCFAIARDAGIPVINADLIAGLSGDSLESFKRTCEWIYELGPENITVHSLTRKRAATLRELGEGACPDVDRMIDYSRRFLKERDYHVYYMYRQKGTVDGLENSGYCLPGTECLYNIFIMDELHTIISCGAGAVTKCVDPLSGSIKRITNYKYPGEYIKGISEMIRRKDRINDFYAGSSETRKGV